MPIKTTTEEIINIISKEDIIEDIDLLKNDISLTEQGADSLDMANIYLVIEEKYSIKFPEKDIDQINSIDDIVIYMTEMDT